VRLGPLRLRCVPGDVASSFAPLSSGSPIFDNSVLKEFLRALVSVGELARSL
jgi:hypothetical protein